MVTVKEEFERALQLARRNSELLLGPPSLCSPPNPSETSGPSMSPGHIGQVQMSPPCSLNSLDSSAKAKLEALEVEESRSSQEDAVAGTGTGQISDLSEPGYLFKLSLFQVNIAVWWRKRSVGFNLNR